MATKALREVIALVDLWAERNGLYPNWHIEVAFVPKLAGDTIAQINWPDGYQDAKLQISEAVWSKATVGSKRRAVIHELRHLVYAPMTERLAAYCGYETLVWKAVKDAMEKICDADAGILWKAYRRKRP